MHNTEARRKQREARNRSNEALLHRAARIGDISNVKRALDLGVDVNCTGSNHDTGTIFLFHTFLMPINIDCLHQILQFSSFMIDYMYFHHTHC